MLPKIRFTAFLLSLLACHLVEAQIAAKLTHNPCTPIVKCNECILLPECAWCMQPRQSTNEPRCFLYTDKDIPKDFCEEKYIQRPKSTMIVTRDFELSLKRSAAQGAAGRMAYGSSYESNYSMSSSGSFSQKSEQGRATYGSAAASGSSYEAAGSSEFVQIRPQRLTLKLRPKETYRVPLQFAQAKDLPLDLYYLMDLSNSMEDDKQKLSTLGGELSKNMSRITSNFRLGFGSFVDKVAMPFVSTVPANLIAPCVGCAAPYGFHNVMPLDIDTYRFSDEVTKAGVSGNLDSPEGGFDAIMQAMVCNEIGWRKEARHLLVFTTDANFHYAGDGKLAGIIEPNDGQCHLDKSLYSASLTQDYPSIAQINQMAKQKAINIIFAVTQDQIKVYEELSKHIKGSSFAELSKDSANVVRIVEEQYNSITSTIQLQHNVVKNVKISYFSKCINGNSEVETSECTGLKLGDVVNFTVALQVDSCPEDPAERKQQIIISPVGLNESMIIDLELLCSCDCDSTNHPSYEPSSKQCNEHGDLICGVCACHEGYQGRDCKCQVGEDSGSLEGCYKNNTGLECSGKGTCQCGTCHCEARSPTEVYSGTYCECNNFSCERNGALICSGPENGECVCGDCHCKEGWSGSSCACRNSTESCRPPDAKDGPVCSGNGECVCNQCKCIDNPRYSGKYCEKCFNCAKKCTELEDCVQCLSFQSGPLKDTCLQNCTQFQPETVDKVVIEEDETLCSFLIDECKVFFKYKAAGDKITKVVVQQDLDCPPQVITLGIVLGLIALIVLVGLAILLLWKLLTTIHDRREFARFEKDRMNAKWDTGENPIYKQATSTFKNPTYAGK